MNDMQLLGGSLFAIALSTAAFVGGHFLLSHPLRATLVGRLGGGGFRGLYTVFALVAFVWMVNAHRTAPHVSLWGDPIWARQLLAVWMLPVVLLFVVGMMTPSPAIVGGERKAFDVSGGLGVHAITRHPGLWGFALWALGHMIANGDAATVILTGGIAVLAFGGMAGIDARKSRDFPGTYGPFLAATSVVPFAAMAAGRTRFDFGKVGIGRLAVGLAVYVAMLFGHRWFVGLSALPL